MYMYMYIHLSGNWRQAGNEMVVREKACIMHKLKQSSLRVNIITVNAYAFMFYIWTNIDCEVVGIL